MPPPKVTVTWGGLNSSYCYLFSVAPHTNWFTPVLEMPESLSSTKACSAEVGTLSLARPLWWACTQRLLLGSAHHLTAHVTVPSVCTGCPDIENRSITDLWNWEN